MQQTLAALKSLVESVRDPLHDDWDAFRLGLLFAQLEYPELNVEVELARVRGMAREQAKNLNLDAPFHEQVRQLIHIFGDELGFDGDKANYYNIRNSFVNDVLLRRKGIPISLTLVFIGLARELGLRAVGISFPGHFLARMVPSKSYLESRMHAESADDWRSQYYIDCFDKGRLLSVEDCERRLRDWTRGLVPFGPEVLKVAHPREILSRQLRNLRAILLEKEDLPRLYWVFSALIELCPEEKVEALRERGLMLARMERFPAACTDFRAYLSQCEDLAKRQHVESLLRMFEDRNEICN